MSWQATEWAITAAPLPKSDPTARLVLAHLGTHADKHGRNAYPKVFTIAYALDLNPQVVTRVLKRLVGYGLISKDGMGPDGQARWTLHLDKQRAEAGLAAFEAKHRRSIADRQARWRDQSAVDDSESSTRVDDDQSSLDVDDPESTSNGLSVHMSRTLDPDVDDSKYPHNRPTTVPNRPTTVPAAHAPNALELDVVEAATPKPRRYTEAFEAFWVAYERKGDKRLASVEWAAALKRADVGTIMAAVGPLVASTPDLKWRKDAQRWLKGDGWESAVVPARTNGNGHTGWTNPKDPNAYHEEW